MRDVQRPAPTGDLDSPEEIGEMVRRFYADVAMDDILGPMFTDETLELGWAGPRADRAAELADTVARVHSQQLVGSPPGRGIPPAQAARVVELIALDQPSPVTSGRSGSAAHSSIDPS